MTKKSAGRQKRDQEVKKVEIFTNKNAAWGDTAALYTRHQNHLNFMSNKIMSFFEIPDIGKFVPAEQHEYARTVASGFQKDLMAFQDRLNKLYAQHSNKTGKLDVTITGEYTFMVQLFSAYESYERDVQMILTPMFTQILALIHTIEQNIQASVRREAAAAAAQAAPTAA